MLASVLFFSGHVFAEDHTRERRSVNCGQKVMLTPMQGAKLQSPRYPMVFEDQNQCMWEIRSFDPQSRIKIFFDDWVMPISPSGGCEVSYLELRELVDGNVQSSVKLCGMNPEFYISNLDHITISLQGDHLTGQDLGPKRFSLRAELTQDPPRTLATDGSFVVNGMTPLPKQFPPVMPPNFATGSQYPGQQQPQRPYPQNSHPSQHQQHHHQQNNQQSYQPMGGNAYLDTQQQPIMKSNNPYQQNPYPPAYGQETAQQPGGSFGQQPDGMYGPFQNQPGTYPIQNNRMGAFPSYDDYESVPEPEEDNELDATTKVTIVLLLIALIAGAVVVMAYIVKRRQDAKKSPSKTKNLAEPNASDQMRHLKLRIKVNAAELSEKVKANTKKANHKIQEKVTKIKTKVNNRNQNHSDV